MKRFALVGVGNTLMDLGLYTALVLAGVTVPIANFFSTSAGMLASFIGNRRFTFRAAGGHPVRQGLLFFAVTAAGLWILQPVVIVAADWCLRTLGLPTGGGWVAVPKLAGIAFGLVWNFVLYRYLVFRPTRLPPEGA